MRTTILALFAIAAIAGPWAGPWMAQAAPPSSIIPPPMSTDGTGDGNQDHVVGEEMC